MLRVDAASLPLSLGDALSAYPTHSAAPILLLVTTISISIAFLAQLISLISATRSSSPFTGRSWKHKRFNDRAAGTTDSESIRSLIHSSETTPHIARPVLVALALALSIASICVEFRDLRLVKAAWNEDDATRVGMDLHLSCLAFMLPIVPILLSLSASLAYMPLYILAPRDRDTSKEEVDDEDKGATISDRSGISGLFGDSTNREYKLSDGVTVFAEVIPPTPKSALSTHQESAASPDKVIMGESFAITKEGSLPRERKSPIRDSWRNTFGLASGIGQAV